MPKLLRLLNAVPNPTAWVVLARMGELSAAALWARWRAGQEVTMTAFVCRRCTDHLCEHEHEEKCNMLLRWYDYQLTFWRPCECQERGGGPVFPVTVRSVTPPSTE